MDQGQGWTRSFCPSRRVLQLEFGILAVLGLLSLLQWFWLCLIHCLVSFFRSPADLNSPEIGGEFCLQFEGADPDVSFS